MEESGTARKRSPVPPCLDPGTTGPVGERGLEEVLLDRWREGDREAGGRLLEGQRNLVFWTCRRHGLRTEEEIADLYQEVVLRISRTLPRLRIERSFAAYVRRTAENTIAERGRPPPAAAPLEGVAEPADPRPSAPDLALREALERCRSRLTPLEEAVYERRFVQGQDYEEVARRVGKTVNHVGVTLFRLVRKMKRCLEASGYGMKP